MVILWVYEVLYVVRFDWEYIYIYILYWKKKKKQEEVHPQCHVCHAIMYLVCIFSCEGEKSHDSDQPRAYITYIPAHPCISTGRYLEVR